MDAFDYDTQKLVTGAAGARLAVEQSERQLAALDDPGYVKFVGLGDEEAAEVRADTLLRLVQAKAYLAAS